jgi:phage terminase large subunit-like protein
MFGLRLGRHPQVVISTTPKPIPLIRWLVEQSKKDPKKYVITKGSTYDNKANLASTFFSQVASYEGTRLGRQELHAELIDPREGGIVKESWFGRYPHDLDLPVFEHILQSYDTAFTEKTQDRKTKDPDPSACSSWGVFKLTPQLRKALKLPDVTPFEYGVLLLDAWDDHLGYPELRAKAEREYRDSYYGPKGDQRRADTVLIEDKGSGISLRQDLQLVVPARPYNPGRADKTERLHSVSNVIKRGAVFIPESRTHHGEFSKWAKKPMEEWCCFPQVVHDDYTDTLTQALSYIKDLGYLVMDIPYEEDEPEEQKKSSNPYGQ